MKQESVDYILEIIQTLREHEFTDYFEFMADECPRAVSEKLITHNYENDEEFVTVFYNLLLIDRTFPREQYKEKVIEFLKNRVNKYVN